MRCEEAFELITGLIDGELSTQETRTIEAHLKECAKCRRVYAEEQNLKRQVGAAAAAVTAPGYLKERLLSDQKTLPKSFRREERAPFWPARFLPRPAFVLALLVLLILPTLYLSPPTQESISLAALELHDRIATGAVLVGREPEEELKARLAQSVGGRFAPMGYDLSEAGLRPAGGLMQELAGKQALVVLYRGTDSALTCFTFLGAESDAPPKATPFFDPEKRIDFYTFSRGRINGVMHREGELICILVSEMPMQDLLALARSKAHPS